LKPEYRIERVALIVYSTAPAVAMVTDLTLSSVVPGHDLFALASDFIKVRHLNNRAVAIVCED
jgi:hypothetical protein